MNSELGIKLLVFDLDGTLVDTRLDIAQSVNATLTHLGKQTLSVEKIISFVGDGVDDLLRLVLIESECHLTELESLLSLALEYFLEHYQTHCTDYSVPYSGAYELLDKYSGLTKAILSNKPLAPALRLLDHLGMRFYFQEILGGDNPYGKKPNPAGLEYILSKLNANPREAVLIGDSLQDLHTAKAGGCEFIAYLGGMGNAEAMKSGNPKYWVNTLTEIPDVLQKIGIN